MKKLRPSVLPSPHLRRCFTRASPALQHFISELQSWHACFSSGACNPQKPQQPSRSVAEANGRWPVATMFQFVPHIWQGGQAVGGHG